MTGLLAEILGQYPPVARPSTPPVPLGNAGGTSGAKLWRFRSGLGLHALRAWPVEGPNRAELAAIHNLLSEARDLAFIPMPIVSNDGRTVVEGGGQLWDLSPWMPGAADLSRPPNPNRLRSGFAGLAALHRRWGRRHSEGPSHGLARRFSEIEELRRNGFDDLERGLERAPSGPARELSAQWLGLARRLAPAESDRLRPFVGRSVGLQPCLRDARPDHLLYEGDRLTGLIDFGAVGLDAVSADLSRLLTEWVGPDRLARAEALSAYSDVRPLDAAESALIDAFARPTMLLMGGHWARWHFLEGRTFDAPAAVLDGLRRGLQRIHELL